MASSREFIRQEDFQNGKEKIRVYLFNDLILVGTVKPTKVKLSARFPLHNVWCVPGAIKSKSKKKIIKKNPFHLFLIKIMPMLLVYFLLEMKHHNIHVYIQFHQQYKNGYLKLNIYKENMKNPLISVSFFITFENFLTYF